MTPQEQQSLFEHSNTVDVDVVVESDLWHHEDLRDVTLEHMTRTAVNTALDIIKDEIEDYPTQAQVCILFADDEAIQKLNQQWRGMNKPTNVLSFPSLSPVIDGEAVMLGDIILAFETIEREAKEEQKPLIHHIQHLVVHGFLHLLGYDHETDDEAQEMEAAEICVLAKLGIDNPYEA